MKNLLLLLLVFFFFNKASSQTTGVSINPAGTPPDSSAILDVSSKNQGMLIPRLSTIQRDSINNPAQGLIIYNLDSDCINMWSGLFWSELCGACAVPNPNITSNSPVCQGDTLQFSSAIYPGASYSWTGPNNWTSNQPNPIIPGAGINAAGTYNLVISAGGCTSQTFSTSVSIDTIPGNFSVGSNGPVIIGANINLTATSVPGGNYFWSGPNSFSSNLQNPSITNASNADSGLYSCYVVLNGCTSSVQSVFVAVNTVNFVTYTSSGTFTVPAGVNSVRVLCVGGGGGGCSGHQGGGGSGYVNTGTISVSPGQNISITVGSGGLGAQAVVSTNTVIGITPGGSSSFGGSVTANGGLVVTGVNQTGNNGGSGGGGACNSGPVGGSGGTNGTNGGSCTYTGGTGQGASFSSGFNLFSANTISGGSGGAGGTGSHAGGGGGGGVLINGSGPSAQDGTQSFSGKGGSGYGAGGGAGTYNSPSGNTRYAGGNGANGLVYIEW